MVTKLEEEEKTRHKLVFIQVDNYLSSCKQDLADAMAKISGAERK
jgi:hypothetical protein